MPRETGPMREFRTIRWSAAGGITGAGNGGRVDFAHAVAALRALEPEWRMLAQASGTGSLFRGPDWLVPWWQHYHQVLGAELHVITGRVESELVCLAPLYKRKLELPLIESGREIRLMG